MSTVQIQKVESCATVKWHCHITGYVFTHRVLLFLVDIFTIALVSCYTLVIPSSWCAYLVILLAEKNLQMLAYKTVRFLN